MITKFEFIRRSRRIKQIELALIMELSPEYISGVERGLVRPSKNFRIRASKALEISEIELFGDEKLNGC